MPPPLDFSFCELHVLLVCLDKVLACFVQMSNLACDGPDEWIVVGWEMVDGALGLSS